MTTKARLLSAAFLLLTSCDNAPASKADLRSAQLAADQRLSQQQARITQLQEQHDRLSKDLNDLRLLVLSVGSAHESLRKTFNRNVDQENQAKVRAMTARGACGTEVVNYPNGGQIWRNKECTMKDLR